MREVLPKVTCDGFVTDGLCISQYLVFLWGNLFVNCLLWRLLHNPPVGGLRSVYSVTLSTVPQVFLPAAILKGGCRLPQVKVCLCWCFFVVEEQTQMWHKECQLPWPLTDEPKLSYLYIQSDVTRGEWESDSKISLTHTKKKKVMKQLTSEHPLQKQGPVFQCYAGYRRTHPFPPPPCFISFVFPSHVTFWSY